MKRLLLLISTLGCVGLLGITGCSDEQTELAPTPLCRCAPSEVCVEDRCVPIRDASVLDATPDAAADVIACAPVPVLINELRTTAATALPDFVELRAEPGARLDGYRLLASDATGVRRVDAILSGVVGDSGLFLAALGDGLEVEPDVTLALVGLSAPSGNLQLFDCEGARVDAVGYGDFSGDDARFRGEGEAAPSPPEGFSLGRCPDAVDTDDNAVDFLTILPSPGAENTCGEGCGVLAECGGACVDTQTSTEHCGACDNACDTSETCAEGSCVESTCTDGQTLCDGSCVDTQTSIDHCGGCGDACTCGGTLCVGGSCVLACPSGQTSCDDGGCPACVDTQTSTDHCGGCGLACAEGQFCSGGQCQDSCELTECGGDCVDTQTSDAHCGSCDNACGTNESCTDGSCALDCAGGGLTECSGACFDTQTSTDHCGACDNACEVDEICTGGVCALDCGGLTECGGACFDTQTSTDHCGACDNACGTNETCTEGSCLLDCGALTECSGACVDTQTSTDHCGACDNVCDAALTCDAGACVCPAGTGDCNDDLAADGCETDTTTSVAHCGACGAVCDATNTLAVTCEASACVLDCQMNFDDCNEDASDGCEASLRDDDANCGACGTTCGAAETCNQGRCR